MVNDRADFAHVASALAERGLAAANIEYRTAAESPYPGAVQDVKAAIRWMRANAKLYGISPDAIGTSHTQHHGCSSSAGAVFTV